jgi:uncharacterized coiled-coil DUF342 family protein
MTQVKLTKPEAEAKVYDLYEQLLFTRRDLKDVQGGYKERIKEIEEEIKGIIEEENAPVIEPENEPETEAEISESLDATQ